MKLRFFLAFAALLLAALISLGACGSHSATAAGASHAYVSNKAGNGISHYTVDSTGELTAAPVPTIAVNGTLTCLVLTSNRRYLYAVDEANNEIHIMSRAGDGSLAPIGTQATGSQPTIAAIDPTDSFLVVTNSGGSTAGAGSISVFAIDISTGDLTPAANSPLPVAGNPVQVAISPTSAYVYVAAQNVFGSNSGAFYGFTLNTSTGALTPIAGSPFAAGVAPNFVAVAPNEQLMVVLDIGTGRVHAYNLASGVPTERSPGSPFTAGGQPQAAVFDPTSTYLFVTAGTGTTQAITWDNGIVTQVTSASSGGTNPAPVYVALSPSGSALYVVNSGNNTISEFTVTTSSSTGGTGGTLNAVSLAAQSTATVGTGTTPSWLVTQ
jgi:6-phosphogluconolactonase (cycloisomerase 2 family)